jgi:hypothetical protein
MKLINILNEIKSDIKERLSYAESHPVDDDTTIETIYNQHLKSIGSLDDYKKFLSHLFPYSKIKKIVYRQGKLELIPGAGGIWFGDSEEDVVTFANSVRREIKPSDHKIHKCLVNITNPYTYEYFWNGYINDTESYQDNPFLQHNLNGRDILMNKLKKDGYDGIYIHDDTWNDTGDNNSVTSEQYVPFSLNQIHSLGSQDDIQAFTLYMSI